MIKKLTGKAIPKKVIVNSYNLLDGILTLDFSEEYLEISKDEEVLIRAAVVLTLTQIESVDYVAFTVNDSALTRRDGTIIGNMQATDFVGSPELAIYSIVNSLSELNYVHKVQIMVNGNTNVSFKGVKLDNAFIRNLDYIENETKEGE